MIKETNKRHTCVVCSRKRVELKMLRYRSHWACAGCLGAGVSTRSTEAAEYPEESKLRVLNLYAGIGGNSHLWPATVSVTAVELNPKVAAAYKELHPSHQVIVGDAHKYLLKNYYKFDFIWSSPPCQTHSRMNYMTKVDLKKYADLTLYQEIILLKTFFKGRYIIENVIPYYDSLIKPDWQISRHLFWSNFKVNDYQVKQPAGFIEMCNQQDKQIIMDWLGIQYHKNIYLSGKNFVQVFKNCVHPKIGLSILNDAINSLKS